MFFPGFKIFKSNIMKFKIIFFLLTFFVASCSKDDDSGGGGGGGCTTAEVRLVNNSSNPYYVYVNGSYNTTMQGNTFIDYTWNEGYYNIKVEQVSGYLFYPTIKETSFNLIACQDRTVSFP